MSYEKIKVPVKLDKISEQTDFYKVMRYSQIPFGHINQEEFLDILQEWNEAGYHLSKGTVDQIRKRRGLSGNKHFYFLQNEIEIS